MVKVSVSSVGTQASTVAISMFSRVSALNDAITKLIIFCRGCNSSRDCLFKCKKLCYWNVNSDASRNDSFL